MATPETWAQSIRAYTTTLRAEGKSEGTITLYRHCLDRAAEHLGGQPWTVTVAELEPLLGDPSLGPSARKSRRTAIASFYRWAQRRGYLDRDIAADLPTVRVPRGLPRPAPDQAIRKALMRAPRRVRVMLRLAAFAGLRATEIARVHRHDLGDDGVLVVHGKGRKDRRVPLGDLEVLDAILGADGWVFPSPYRSGSGHLTPNHVSKLMSSALPAPFTAHTLRHRFGTVSFAGTQNLLAVSRLLGHSSTVTTEIYVDLPSTHLREAVAAASAARSPDLRAA